MRQVCYDCQQQHICVNSNSSLRGSAQQASSCLWLPGLGSLTLHGRQRCPPVFVQVNISTDADLGTVYSVAVPIKRVKPVARVPMSDDIDMDGITLRWDAEDKESDPSDQFPFGC